MKEEEKPADRNVGQTEEGAFEREPEPIEHRLIWRETNLRNTNKKGIAVVHLRTYKSMN